MNEHEIARLAAAFHALRPDWPAASLRTFIAKNLASRPQRDVAVALAYIACESGTNTPARVLESGPWWRAAATEAPSVIRNTWDPAVNCGICSKPEHACRAIPETVSGHTYVTGNTVRAQQRRREENA